MWEATQAHLILIQTTTPQQKHLLVEDLVGGVPEGLILLWQGPPLSLVRPEGLAPPVRASVQPEEYNWHTSQRCPPLAGAGLGVVGVGTLIKSSSSLKNSS